MWLPLCKYLLPGLHHGMHVPLVEGEEGLQPPAGAAVQAQPSLTRRSKRISS
jgi:hypothetical protein